MPVNSSYVKKGNHFFPIDTMDLQSKLLLRFECFHEIKGVALRIEVLDHIREYMKCREIAETYFVGFYLKTSST